MKLMDKLFICRMWLQYKWKLYRNKRCLEKIRKYEANK